MVTDRTQLGRGRCAGDDATRVLTCQLFNERGSMKRQAVAAVMMSIALLSACGEDDPVEGATDEASEAAEDATESAESESPADEGGGGSGTVLIGTVGTADDPDAFEIALTTEDGEPVESIPAGDYTIEVDDPSAIHNFHLTGGSVDETTSVPEQEQATFEVTLEPGEYTYVCDPHPPMTGSFTVT
jgi:plastocyanin